jgi:hypothetical protein
MSNTIIAQADIWGRIGRPSFLTNLGGDPGAGIGRLINVGLNVLVVGAGIYALFNFVLAGYSFMSAGGDPGKIANAWAKIWQTAVGLALVAGTLVIAAIFGELIFDDPTFFITPSIPTP